MGEGVEEVLLNRQNLLSMTKVSYLSTVPNLSLTDSASERHILIAIYLTYICAASYIQNFHECKTEFPESHLLFILYHSLTPPMDHNYVK